MVTEFEKIGETKEADDQEQPSTSAGARGNSK